MNWKKLANKEEPRQVTSEIRVRCNGKKHRILWDGYKRRLMLLDHSKEEIRRLKTLKIFGDTCRCLCIANAWANRDEAQIPEGLKEAFYSQRLPERRQRSARNQYIGAADYLGDRKEGQVNSNAYLVNRNFLRIQQKVGSRLEESIRQNGYYPENLCITVRFEQQKYTTTCWKYLHFILPALRMKSHAMLHLPYHWPLFVESPGLSFIENVLVLDVWSPYRQKLFKEYVSDLRNKYGSFLFPSQLQARLQLRLPSWLMSEPAFLKECKLDSWFNNNFNSDDLERADVSEGLIPAVVLTVNPAVNVGVTSRDSLVIDVKTAFIEEKQRLRPVK